MTIDPRMPPRANPWHSQVAQTLLSVSQFIHTTAEPFGTNHPNSALDTPPMTQPSARAKPKWHSHFWLCCYPVTPGIALP
jgi:hypothetical protein